jgi:hypothetical protein
MSLTAFLTSSGNVGPSGHEIGDYSRLLPPFLNRNLLMRPGKMHRPMSLHVRK